MFLMLIFSVFALSAQTHRRNFKQREIGVFGGASYYIGDINPRTHFLYSMPAAGAFYRIAMTYRYAFRFGFSCGSVWADDAKSHEADQLERNINFKSKIYEAHALYEFNFVDYRIGSEKHYFTMFLFAGLGAYYMNPKSDIGYGTVNLSELRTEGRYYSKFQVCLPFGVGMKWNATDRIGFGFEWGPRKLFTDYLDDVSSAYPVQGTGTYYGQGAPGTMRGNPRSKDWYFFYGFTVQVRLPKKNQECHGMGVGGA